MLEATGGVLLFDHLRVPYRKSPSRRSLPDDERTPGELISVRGDDGTLSWLRAPSGGSVASVPGAYRLGSTPIFGRVVPDAASRRVRDALGGSRTALAAVSDDRGETVASVWRCGEGNTFLPFDPDELIANLWSERYRAAAHSSTRSRLEAVARPLYYRARVLLPVSVRLRMRRAYTGVQVRSSFPGWPVETALDDLCRLVLALVAEAAGQPVPMLSLWPRDRTWAFVLTHDVERSSGYAAIDRLRSVERRTGSTSSWNFVPLRDYRVDAGVLDGLRSEGCEIGVHGLHHDGRDLAPGHVAKRRPLMRRFADDWGATGFRSPSLLRDFDVVPSLGFDYDSSYPDTDPFQAQPGGCCSWLPFFNRETVELPVTLAQDHNVFELLGEADERLWREKTTFLRERGGMALLLTHPDYMLDRERLDAYERLLGEFASDATAWRALPREVSDWWRRRAASTPVRRDGAWRVEGPAERDGSVSFWPEALRHQPGALDGDTARLRPARTSS